MVWEGLTADPCTVNCQTEKKLVHICSRPTTSKYDPFEEEIMRPPPNRMLELIAGLRAPRGDPPILRYRAPRTLMLCGISAH